MRFEPTLAVATLSVLATCTPLRASFIKDDGTFDLDGAMAHLAHIENKYRQNRINIMRNVGGEAFNNSADTEPLPAVPVKLQKRRIDSTIIALENHNGILTGPIKIGTPNQELRVTFDTGATDLWVTSQSCIYIDYDDYIGCDDKKTYDYSISASRGDAEFRGFIQSAYGNVSGMEPMSFLHPPVQVGGINFYQQYFVDADILTNSFVGRPQDGVLGMAYQGLSSINRPSFIYTVIRDKAVPINMFAFALGETGSSLCLGGVEKSKFTHTTIEYHNVADEKKYWKIVGASAFVDEFNPLAVLDPDYKFETIIDSGSAFILGPPEDIQRVFNTIGNALSFKTEDGKTTYYHLPCNHAPRFKIGWGKQQWEVYPKHFHGGITDRNPNMCISNVMGVEFMPEKTWILGTAFMKNVYTIFNFENYSVGFAKRRPNPNSN